MKRKIKRILVVILLILIILLALEILKEKKNSSIFLFENEIKVNSCISNGKYERTYSWYKEDGLCVILSYGTRRDYIIDIDNDGDKELICSYKSSERQNVYIYKMVDGILRQGIIKEKVDPKNKLYGIIDRYIDTQYDPIKDKFLLYNYTDGTMKEVDYRAITYHIYETPSYLLEEKKMVTGKDSIGI